MSQRLEDVVPVPIVKINALDVEKLLAKLRERVKESVQTSVVKNNMVSAVSELADYYTDLVSATTSDVIISPLVSDQVLLTDAQTMVSATVNAVLTPMLDEIESHLKTGKVEEYIKSLYMYIQTKKLCFDAMIQVLKRRLTHIYVNMPPNLRPSLGSASIGYEKLEPEA